ncbi:MAG: rhamnulokinase family protein [Planctomycetota bacterium]
MASRTYIACDLGAESGRVMRGVLADGQLTMEEIHRFPTGGIVMGDSLRWDLPRILEELRTGVRVAAKDRHIDGISTDSWGVDYVLTNSSEAMISLPYHYRDRRGDTGFQRVFLLVPRSEIYRETGIQFITINSIYQLQWDASRRPAVLAQADRFLMIADWINWAFSNVAVAEETLASTSQLYNPHTRQWSSSLIEKLGIPARIFPQVVPAGSVLGPAIPELGIGNAQVIATCSHDTGAAVAAVPAEGEGWAYLSSGTWSLIGVEAPAPIATPEALAENYTNELGVAGTVRFLKNIVGLWIVQECRRHWEAEGTTYSYDELTRLAGEAKPLASFINPADARFAGPGDMPIKIGVYCRETGQPIPEGPGAMIRCVLESLALTYRRGLEALESLTGQKLSRLHVVGGGSKNRLLNQFAANATGRSVITGPVEATAIGNLLVQALALGHIKDLAELRAIVRRSFPVETWKPQDHAAWEATYKRFVALP